VPDQHLALTLPGTFLQDAALLKDAALFDAALLEDAPDEGHEPVTHITQAFAPFDAPLPQAALRPVLPQLAVERPARLVGAALDGTAVELAQRAGGISIDGDPAGLSALRAAYRLTPALTYAA
jgi:hypothetical protein